MLQQLISDNIWFVAAAWMGLALLASVISIRLGVSVALIEIGMGVTPVERLRELCPHGL